jgi:hypothetical protein
VVVGWVSEVQASLKRAGWVECGVRLFAHLVAGHCPCRLTLVLVLVVLLLPVQGKAVSPEQLNLVVAACCQIGDLK